MPSGSRSVGGTCTVASLPDAGIVGIAPVVSLAGIGAAAACGIATCALSSVFGAELLIDCRPIGVGEVIEGAAGAGVAGWALFSAGGGAGAGCSLEFFIDGIGGRPPGWGSGISLFEMPGP